MAQSLSHSINRTLYALNGSNDQTALLSEAFMNGGVYRNGQEIAVDTGSSFVSAMSSGNWSVRADSLRFEIDLTDTGLSLTDGIAMHWGPTCGNDIIEGFAATAVPEPGAVGLMLAGVFAAGAARRRRKRD